MSRNSQETARGYRDRADELRLIAANFVHEPSRRDLLALADQWDHMAERLERNPSPEILPDPLIWAERKLGD